MPTLAGINAVYDFSLDNDDNAASVVSLAAGAKTRHMVRSVLVSYEAAASAADHLLTIAWTLAGVAKILTYAIAAGDASPSYPLDFPEGLIVGDENTAITITLGASGTAGSLGYLNVFHRNVGVL